MNIIINNPADVSNKYIRQLKWKLYNLKEKFENLIYVEGFVKSEGNSPALYAINLRLGVAGNDIILRNASRDIQKLIHLSYQDAHRYLAARTRVRV